MISEETASKLKAALERFKLADAQMAYPLPADRQVEAAEEYIDARAELQEVIATAEGERNG